MSRYLVTGGCGFIGSHLVDALLADGHAVEVVDDLSTGARANLDPRAALTVADLRDPATAPAATEGVDGVFHLAAVASVARCNEAWHDSHRVNLGATVALLEALRGRGVPFVYASSAAVYGAQERLPIGEDAPPAPLGAYGADKLACELHARAGATVHGIASCGVRFFNIYGPRQRPDDAYAGVISTFVARLGAGLPITIHGDGGQTRDFVHVADAALALRRAMAVLAAAPAPRALVCNVATGAGTTVLGLARTLGELLGRDPEIRHGPPRPGDIRLSTGATARARELLGFTAATALRDGLAATLRASG
jgi:UDP-glucose 4-epimerase